MQVFHRKPRIMYFIIPAAYNLGFPLDKSLTQKEFISLHEEAVRLASKDLESKAPKLKLPKE